MNWASEVIDSKMVTEPKGVQNGLRNGHLKNLFQTVK